MTTMLGMSQQVTQLQSQLTNFIANAGDIIQLSLSGGGGSVTAPTVTTSQLIQYDNDTTTANTNTVVDPIVVSRRTAQINDTGSMAVALQQQAQVMARLTAQAAAAGLPIGSDAGRYMGRFAVGGQISLNGNDQIRILDMDITFANNIYCLCVCRLDHSNPAYMCNLDGTLSSSFIRQYNGFPYYVYMIKYNSSGVVQWVNNCMTNSSGNQFWNQPDSLRNKKILIVDEVNNVYSFIVNTTISNSSQTVSMLYGANIIITSVTLMNTSGAANIPVGYTGSTNSATNITYSHGTYFTSVANALRPPECYDAIPCRNFNSVGYVMNLQTIVNSGTYPNGPSPFTLPSLNSYRIDANGYLLSGSTYRYTYFIMSTHRSNGSANNYTNLSAWMWFDNYEDVFSLPRQNTSIGFVTYISTIGNVGLHNSYTLSARTRQRIVLVTNPSDPSPVSPASRFVELVRTSNSSNGANDVNWCLGGAISLALTSLGANSRTNAEGNHYVFAYARGDVPLNSFSNLSCGGTDNSTTWALSTHSYGCVAISLTSEGNITHVSPMINVRATINKVNQVRTGSNRILVTMNLQTHLMTDIPKTITVFKLNISPNVTIVTDPLAVNTHVAAIIPFTSSPFLTLVYDGVTGALVYYFESDSNGNTTFEYADKQLMTNSSLIGVPSSITSNAITTNFTEQYPIDVFGYSLSGGQKAVNLNTILPATARQSLAQTIMNGMTGQFTCSYTANNILVVAGYLVSSATFRVPRLTGVSSSFHILPTPTNANANWNPFMIVYSLEDGEVITAGRLMDVASSDVNVYPTAVAYCPKNMSIWMSCVSTGSTTGYRYNHIYNNMTNASTYFQNQFSNTYSFTTPANGCFILSGVLHQSQNQFHTASSGVQFIMPNATITTMTVVPSTQNIVFNELVISGFTTNTHAVFTHFATTGTGVSNSSFSIGSYNGNQTAFLVKIIDFSNGSATVANMIDAPSPSLIGGSATVAPSYMKYTSTGELCMIGTLGTGTVRMFNLTSEWFPYVSDTTTANMDSTTTATMTNAFDGNASSIWTSPNFTEGVFTGAGSGAYLTYRVVTAYDLPLIVSGVRIVAASASDTTRPKNIIVMYNTTTTNGLTAYTSPSGGETYIGNVMEVFFAAIADVKDIMVYVTQVYGGTSVTITELRFMGTSQWFPNHFREDTGSSRQLWGSVTQSSTIYEQGSEHPFRYRETSGNLWNSSTFTTYPTNNTYSVSTGLYTGTQSRGGEWLYWNNIARYGRTRSFSRVRIVFQNNTFKPLRFKVITVVSGIETTVYTSAADEASTVHINNGTYFVTTLTMPQTYTCDAIYLVVTKSNLGEYTTIYGCKFFDPTETTTTISYTTPLTSSGFLAKWGPDGKPKFIGSPLVSDTGLSIVSGMDIDINNNIYVSGHFNGVGTFKHMSDGTSATNVISSGVYDVFMVKYSSLGALQQGRRVLGGSGVEQNTLLRVGVSGMVYLTGVFASATATPYNLSDGSTPAGLQPISANSATSDVFMLTFDNQGVCKYATNVMSSTTADSIYCFEMDKHEGYFLGGQVGSSCVAKDHYGNALTLSNTTSGHIMMRIPGGQQKNTVQILPYQSKQTPIQWCDMQYVYISSTEAYLFVLMAITNNSTSLIPNLDGTLSSKVFTRTTQNRGLYLVKYDAIVNTVLFGDLVTSAIVYTGSALYHYHACPRLRVTSSGDVYVCATVLNAQYDTSLADTYRHSVYNLNGTSGSLTLPFEYYSNQTRILLVKYNMLGVAQLANYVVNSNPSGLQHYITAMDVDSDNNVYIAFISQAYNSNTTVMTKINHLNQAKNQIQITSAFFGQTNNSTINTVNITSSIVNYYNTYKSGGSRYLSNFVSLYGDPWSGNVKTLWVNYNGITYKISEYGQLDFESLKDATFGTVHNNTANPNFASYCMKLAVTTGDVQWARLIVNDQYPSGGYYTSIQGLHCIGSYLYMIGNSTALGPYNIYNSNGTVFSTISSGQNNTLHMLMWIVKVNSFDSSIIKAQRVLNGFSANIDTNINSTFLDKDNKIWIGLNYNPYDSNNARTVMMYDLVDGANNAIYSGDNWAGSYPRNYALRLNTATDRFDLASKRGLTTYNNLNSRTLSGCSDSAGNLYFLLSMQSFNRTLSILNFDGSIGAHAPYANLNTTPYLVVKYNLSGVYQSCFNLSIQSSVISFGTMKLMGDTRLVIGASRNTFWYMENQPYSYISANIMDENGSLIAPLFQQNISPLVIWNQDYTTQASANNPIYNLRSYISWANYNAPLVSSSIGITVNSYGFGIYTTPDSSVIPQYDMSNIISPKTLPGTATTNCLYMLMMDSNKQVSSAFQLARNASSMKVAKVYTLATGTATELIFAVVLTDALVVYNLDGTPSVLTVPVAEVGNVVILRYSLSTLLCTSIYKLIDGEASIVNIHYDAYTNSVLLTGNLASPTGSIKSPDGLTSKDIVQGGFVIRINSENKLSYGGTIIEAGTVIDSTVSTLGKLAIACNTGASTNLFDVQSTPTNYNVPANTNAILMLGTDGSKANAMTTTATIISIRFTLEDELITCCSASGDIEFRNVIVNDIISSLTAETQSTNIIWLNRDWTLKYSRIVATNSTPVKLELDSIGGIYVLGTLSDTTSIYNLSNGVQFSSANNIPTSETDAFMLTFLNTGVITKFSHLTTMSTIINDFRIETSSNTLYISMSTSGVGQVNDNDNVLLVSITQSKNFWLHYPLNIDTSAMTTIINVNLPSVELAKLVTNKKIVLPTGVFKINLNNNTSELYQVPISVLNSSITYNCTIGDWQRSA